MSNNITDLGRFVAASGVVVLATVEKMRDGETNGLVVREQRRDSTHWAAPVVLALPLDHVSVPILSVYFDAPQLLALVSALAQYDASERAAARDRSEQPEPARPLRDGEFDMEGVVDALWQRYGIHAYVEQTGGGTATIYAGERIKVGALGESRWVNADGDDEQERYECAAGPGAFRGPGWSNGVGYVADFYVGPDDEDGAHAEQMPEGLSSDDAAEWAIEAIVATIAKRRLTLDDDDDVPAWVRQWAENENAKGGE